MQAGYRKSSWVIVSILATLSLLLSACSGLGPVTKQTPSSSLGQVEITADIAPLVLSAAASPLTINAILTKDNLRFESVLSSTDAAAQGAFDSLPVGVWSLEIFAADATGNVIYAAADQVTVLPDTTAAVTLTLTARPGKILVTADTATFPNAKGVRVHFSPGGYTTLDPVDNLFEGEKDLVPGSYDFQVVLYGDGFLAGDRIYAGPWQPLEIAPGEQKSLTWAPSTGGAAVTGKVDLVPPAPTGLTAAYEGTAGNATLQWTASTSPDSDVAGYNIYERSEVFGAFELVASGSATNAVILVGQLAAGETRWFAVTSVDAAGQESPRSATVSIQG